MSSVDMGQESIPSTTHGRQSAEKSRSDFVQSVFHGSGEMAGLMRATDWSKTALGAPEGWSPALRMMANFLLANRFPQLLWWGPQFCSLYNDAYIPILGAKLPWALGQPVSEVWKEIWHVLKPLIETPFRGGPATWMEDIPLELNRKGFFEETHFTIAYSPVPDDSVLSGIGGVLATVHEITDKVIGERRVHALRELGAHSAEPKTAEEACSIVGTTLSSFPKDIPFALLYLLDEKQPTARLACCVGVDPKDRACPSSVRLDTQEVWPLSTVHTAEELRLVEEIPARFDAPPPGPWAEAPSMAAVVPIRSNLKHQLAGFMVAGISSRIPFDQNYRDFLELMSTQIATMIANARAYEQERRRAEALAELDRAKTVFFSNISHELRTPLTLLLGPTESALSSTDGALKGSDLEMVHRNELRLLKLVNTLLDFSRFEAGRVQAVYEPTDLSTLTADIASAFRSAIEKAGLQFTVSCEPIHEPIYVDRQMWEKIILNLLSNALKFTFEGRIELTLHRVGKSIELVVLDTGVGIAHEELARVFERFHRVENVRARTHEGTGIGLALVQELVKLHGGSVHVDSELGVGSTFRITVPTGTAHIPPERIQAVSTQRSTAVSAEAYIEEAERWMSGVSADPLGVASMRTRERLEIQSPVPGDQRKLIVIADDNADMREYLAHLLGEHYVVHAVADGVAAIKAARQLRPALVLTDVMMPGLDGFGVLREIRSDEELRGIPVILLSARAGEESRVEGLQAGADDYLVKPFTARELMARVATHMRMATMRREVAERESKLRAEADRERRRLQELLARAPAAIGLLTGPDHRWTYVNAEYIRLTGRRSAADFIGRTILESLPELKAQVFVDLLNQVYRTGEPYFGREMRAMLNRSAQGLPDESYWDFVYQPVRNADGNVEGILVHAVEVTDKVTARNIVAESAERLLLAQSAAQIGTWEWDPARDWRVLSPELHRLFGTEARDPEHVQKWMERVHREDWEKVQERMAEGNRSGEMDFEYRYLHPQEGMRWFYCKGRRFRNESRIVGIVQDITQRKEAEEALAESEERYRTVAETASDAIFSIDERSTILFANSATDDVFGYSPEELVGKNLTILMPEYMRHLHQAGLQRYVTSGTRHLNWDGTELPGLHKDGREIPLEVSFGEYAKAGKRYFTGFARDVTQRKLAERALRESEQKLRVVTDATPIMIWMSGTDKLCFYFNKSWLDFVGRTLEQEAGNGWAENVHPDDFDRCLQIYVASFDARQPFEMEYRLRHHSGEYRWILDHGVPRFTADGVFEGYVGGCLDIHEKKQAAEKVRFATEALRHSEERFRALVTATSYVVYRMSPDWSEMRQLDGHGFISDTQESRKNWIDIYIYPDDQALVLSAINRAIETRSVFQLEHRVRRVDGTLGWTFSRAVPVLDNDGNIVEWFGAATDVTDRKVAEEARQRLAAIVESSGDAIISKDLNGIVTSWNPQAERLFGYKEEEMVGRSILKIIPPELHNHEITILNEIRGGRQIEHFETIRIARSGERVDVSISISPVRDDHGNIVGAAKIVRDIREKKRMEAALQTTEKLAAAGRLAATVAHEINNPLEAITNLVYLARSASQSTEVRSLLTQADEELTRVALLSKQTLGFYRERNGVKPLRVGSIAESLVAVFSRKARNKSVEIGAAIRQDPEIYAIESEIRQVIANLLNNSIDAVGDGGTIRVRVSAGHGGDRLSRRGVRVTVADTGRGIAPQHRTKLFQPFFTAGKDVGTGLGLWISKNIIEKHGGTIRFRTRTTPGKSGTAFTVFLPCDVKSHSVES